MNKEKVKLVKSIIGRNYYGEDFTYCIVNRLCKCNYREVCDNCKCDLGEGEIVNICRNNELFYMCGGIK